MDLYKTVTDIKGTSAKNILYYFICNLALGEVPSSNHVQVKDSYE